MIRSASGSIGDPAVLAHRGDQEHVGALLAGLEVEPLAARVPAGRRGERAEALAELDLQVHRGLHRRGAGVAQDAPGPEGPRAELHPALEPADDLAVGQQRGDVLEQLGLVVEPLARPPLPRQEPARSASVVKRGPRKLPCWLSRPVGVAGLLQELVPDEQGRAQGAAGVAGRRLDPEIVERALAQAAGRWPRS